MSKRGEENKENNQSTIVSDIAVQYIPSIKNNNASSDQLNTLTDELKQLKTVRANCTPESTGGYAAELQQKRTFLANAAKNGHRNLDVKIGPRGGHGSKGTPDLTIIEDGKPVVEAGLKFRAKSAETVFDHSNIFDRGRQKICPDEQFKRVKELAKKRAETGTLKSLDYSDTAVNSTNRLEFKGNEATPLKKQESIDIVKDPSRYIKEAFKNDLSSYSKTGAATGAVLSGVTSIINNTFACVKCEKEVGQAVKDVTVDTVKGSVKGAAVGATTAVVKQGLLKAGSKNLAGSSAPAAIATSVFEAATYIAKDAKKLSNGQINGGKFALNAIGHTASAAAKGASAYAGAEMGATIGVVGGPVGVAVGGLLGGIIGYIISDQAVGAITNLLR